MPGIESCNGRCSGIEPRIGGARKIELYEGPQDRRVDRIAPWFSGSGSRKRLIEFLKRRLRDTERRIVGICPKLDEWRVCGEPLLETLPGVVAQSHHKYENRGIDLTQLLENRGH